MSDMQTPNSQPETSPAERRKKQTTGMVILAAIGFAVAVWSALHHRSPAADQQLKAFAAAKPEIVTLSGTNAPVVTADDVIPPFFALNDMATPAEARMAADPLFDVTAPRQVWLMVNPAWAGDTQIKDLESLLTDFKTRNIATVMILPPQAGETDDSTIDALANLANSQGVTFLDYHDGDKLGEPLCALEDNDADADMQNEQLATSLTTQQMLLHMAVNAPDTRAELKLADIGARIEKMKAEANCAPAKEDSTEEQATAPAADDAATTADTPAEGSDDTAATPSEDDAAAAPAGDDADKAQSDEAAPPAE